MRGALVLLSAAMLLGGPGAAAAVGETPHAGGSARVTLRDQLAAGMRSAGPVSGAEVIDLSTGRRLYADRVSVGRHPASVQKLYTTSTVLLRFGPRGRLRTRLLTTGTMHGHTLVGTLYLRGGGDPSFGSVAFDRRNYHAGATVQRLVDNLVRAAGLRALRGRVVADESMLDSLRGTPATGLRPAYEVEGELSALAFNRGWADPLGTVYYRHPAVEAAQRLIAALRRAGVAVPRGTPVRAGRTPHRARALAAVASPSIAKLISLTNTPSDNFFAETLLKDLGARYGAGGSTAAGAAVVRAAVAARFGLHPRLNDGSGLSRYDHTSPAQVVSLLAQQARDRPFVASLAVAGRTGTLRHRLRGSYAMGRCRGKTGTLTDASNLVGYCRARDGHTLAFAFLMNSINPDYAHPIQDRMAVAVARYDG